MIQSWIESFKSLVELADGKRAAIFSWIFFLICITFLYNDNTSLKEQLKVKDEACAKMLNDMQVASNNNCQKQLDENRRIMQEQLNSYIVKSNQQVDSLYKKVDSQVQEIRSNYRKTVNDFNQIKNESIN
jgi:hypothetical protein